MKQTRLLHCLVAAVCCSAIVCLSAGAAMATTFYVIENGTGSGNSWANASGDLQAMISAANPYDEIWVAAGTYKPQYIAGDGTTNRDKAFVLKVGVKIYGGFAGTETTLADRDWATNVTTLSGDLNGDDTPGDLTTSKGDNAYHVVISAGAVDTALLDGFTISGGYADGSGNITVNLQTIVQNGGGGMYNNTSSPTLTNVTISENGGGGMLNDNSSPVLTNVTISGNSAQNGGGGMYNYNSSPVLTNLTISGNSADGGGGMYNMNASPVLTNVTISGNIADGGGGMVNNYNSSPTLTNCIVWGNTAIGGNNNVFNNNSSIPTYAYSLVQGSGSGGWGSFGTDGGNNIDDDPLFVNWINPTTVSMPTTAGDYSLRMGSPCIDTGNNAANGTSFDLAGNPRIYGSNIDMGAYEAGPPPTPDVSSGIVYVTVTGAGTGDGSSWGNAYPGLANPLLVAKTNTTITQIWVAAGTYKPQYRAAATDDSGIPTTDRARAFVLVPNVKIYGGFAGNEPTIDDRPIPPLGAGGLSTLSGDIDDTVGISGGDACHVVISAGSVGAALLDGFTISGGNANDAPGSGSIIVNSITNIDLKGGGGMSNWSSSPALTNVTISGNYAIGGGGMFNDNSSPTLTNVTISGNYANDGGGGIVNANSLPALTNVTISGNYAAVDGGGIVNVSSSPALNNVTISGNSATNIGGGIVNVASSPTLTNVTISGNYAAVGGGGMYNENASSPTLTNCIVWGNTANGSVDNVDNDGSSTPTYDYSVVEGQTLTGTGNLNGASDPQFVAPALASATPTTAGDYRLQVGSPCINAGDTVAYKTARGIANFTDEKDLAGNPRIFHSTIDMGAYEAAPTPDTNGIVYVTVTGNGTGDGSSWTDAYAGLADPLFVAKTKPAIRQIWVAAGDYLPQYAADNVSTDPRDKAFVLVPDVKIYGGFAGIATDTSIADRDLTNPVNVSTLSGDIGTIGDSTDNAYHVVISADTVGDALLDGFTISGGNADGSGSTITVNSITIDEKSGGGMSNYNSSPAFTNVTISGNYAIGGGGMFNDNSAPTLSNVTISGNYAAVGGGMGNISSSPVLTNVTISGNSATNIGGGIVNVDSSPVLTNVTISGNYAANDGGGVYNENSSPVLTNCIVWGNTAGGIGSNVYNDASIPTYAHSLVEGSGSSGWSSFGTDGGNNIDGDPLFVAHALASAMPTTAGDYSLQQSSPCINVGDNSANGTSTDLAGNPRLYGSNIDMGAYEAGPLPTPDGAGIVYVTVTGDGAGDGSSWGNAYPGLANPLLIAKTNTAITQIWVAAGTYKPQYKAATVEDGSGNPTTDRDRAFVLVPDVKIYGGFVGIAETSIDDRDLTNPANVSALSGDIDDTVGISGGDACHVVISAGAVGNALLDGFTISGGNTSGSGSTITVNSQTIDRNYGGGMSNRYSSPALTNLTISGNYAAVGGGMHNINSSSPTLTNVTISGNNAGSGGGMVNTNSSPTLTNVTISGNNANGYGGGMLNYFNSSPTLTNVTISGNNAINGGYGGGGGMFNDNNCSPALTNVTISGNSSDDGGGMLNNSNSSPTLTNVTISGNYAVRNGGGMANFNSSSPKLTNSIVWGNTATTDGANVFNYYNSNDPTYAYSLVQGSGGSGSGSWISGFGIDGGNNIDDNPLFVVPALASATPTTAGDYRLQQGSPCINAGDNAANLTATDLAGNPRIVHSAIDMGAYETAIPIMPDVNGIVYVTVTGNGNKDGSSWTDAYAGLADPLLVADQHRKGTITTTSTDTIREIWVAAGTYYPQHIAGNGATDRDKAFVLANNVKIYGGFAGIATDTSIADRDWVTNVTTLSGDIDGNNTLDNSNAYHVVISAGAVGATLLDGFTISGGFADGGSGYITVNSQRIDQNGGGGMYNYQSSPALTNLTISGNSVESGNGGGMYNTSSSPVLTNVTISGNSAEFGGGGGMYNDGGSSPTLTNVTISGNSAEFGGGMYSMGSSPTLTNVTMSGNSAEQGGGMYYEVSSPVLTNCILWGNTATTDGNNVFDQDGTSTPTYAHSLIGDVDLTGTGAGNLDGTLPASDPLFVAPAFGDYRLQRGSPCIGVGDTVAYKTARSIANFTGEKDVAGDARLQYILIDMGAYESPYKRTLQRATVVLADTVYGTALAPTLTGGNNPAGADTLYIYSISQNGVYAPTPPTAVGTYWVKGVIEETPAYYADTTAAVMFEIKAVTSSSNTDVDSVTVSNTTQPTGATDFYLADCGDTSVQITVTPVDSTSQVIYNGTVGNIFTVDIPRADIYNIAYTVRSTDGNEQDYTLQIERRFAFVELVGMKFNNVLYVNNNTDNNGGYEFKHYEWFRNEQPIGIDQQYYSAGPARTDLLDPAVDYSAAVTTKSINGIAVEKVLHVCPGRVTLTSTSSLRAYPNPVPHGTTVTLESPAADGSVIRIYNITGGLIDDTKQLYNGKAQLTAPQATGIYLITVDGEMAKVVVK